MVMFTTKTSECRCYIVATPIGNLEDITHRAIRILKTVDIIAAEDTRRTKILLSHYQISPTRMISCRARNEPESARGIVKLLREGNNIAYVSDAGTPALSDPGSRLVNTVREAGFNIVPIPGASALAALISVAGVKSKGFIFEGFLSPKKGRRNLRLQELFKVGMPFVVYESSRRVLKLVEELKVLQPDCKLFLGREITKKFEEFIFGNVDYVLAELTREGRLMGEFAIVVGTEKYYVG